MIASNQNQFGRLEPRISDCTLSSIMRFKLSPTPSCHGEYGLDGLNVVPHSARTAWISLEPNSLSDRRNAGYVNPRFFI
jgi:hypothetical protein